MKKLNIFASTLALLAALVGFTGCPSVNADQEALIDLSSYYVRGSCGSWDANSDSDNLLTTNDDGTYEYTFLAAAESVNFAIDDGNWTVTYRKDSSGNLLTWALDEEILAYAGNDANCPELSGLTIGTYYTVTVTPYSSYISVKITEGESTAKKFYILADDAIESLTYNGTNYTYSFTSSGDTESLVIYSGDTFYYGTAALNATDVALTATTYRKDSESKENNVVTLTGLTKNTNYVATFSYNSTEKVLSVAKIAKDFVLAKADIIGDLSSVGEVMTVDDSGVASYTFTYSNSMTAWGGGTGTMHFKIRKIAGAWSGDWGYDGITTSGDLPSGVTYVKDDDNPCLKGLVDGTSYTLTFTASEDESSLTMTVTAN